jgi:hypothetical protein
MLEVPWALALKPAPEPARASTAVAARVSEEGVFFMVMSPLV